MQVIEMIIEKLRGGDVIFGFAAAWLLIVMAKMIIAPVFQRQEDYYEERSGEHDG